MEERRKRSNSRHIAFILSSVAIVAVIIIAVVNVNRPLDCGENSKVQDGKCVYAPESDTYTFERDYSDKKKHMKITVEVPKSLGYVRQDSDVRLELYRESDRSTISIYQMLTNKNSIAMQEEDYAKSAWKGYKKTENEDGSVAVEINRIRLDGSISGVEWSKAFEKVTESAWSGVRVTAMASGLDQGKDSTFNEKEYKTFNARETFESEEFQYLLESIKTEVTDI